MLRRSSQLHTPVYLLWILLLEHLWRKLCVRQGRVRAIDCVSAEEITTDKLTCTSYADWIDILNIYMPSQISNTGKDSHKVYTSLPFIAVTYLIMQYFALIILNLKLKFCAEESWELLTNILGSHQDDELLWDPGQVRHSGGSWSALSEVLIRCLWPGSVTRVER